MPLSANRSKTRSTAVARMDMLALLSLRLSPSAKYMISVMPSTSTPVV